MTGILRVLPAVIHLLTRRRPPVAWYAAMTSGIPRG
jgi:hypothetical protein